VSRKLGNALLLAAVLVASPLSGFSQSGATFQCQSGADSAVINACGARWEAANIRAHVAAGQYGGMTPSCLTKTASLLDEMAARWLQKGAFTAYKGPWPCGSEPPIGKADDGALANACPGSEWSYKNRGQNSCRPLRVAQYQQSAPAYAPPRVIAPAPAFTLASTPLPTETPVDFNQLQNLMNVDQHRYRYWDGGSVSAGDFHDRSSSSNATFTGCSFQINWHESDADGREWTEAWSGSLRDLDPTNVALLPYASEPTNWLVSMTTQDRQPLLRHSGSYKNEDGDTEDYNPDDATSVIRLIFPNRPRDVVDTLRAAIYSCRPD
jgi:hypothetical protein